LQIAPYDLQLSQSLLFLQKWQTYLAFHHLKTKKGPVEIDRAVEVLGEDA